MTTTTAPAAPAAPAVELGPPLSWPDEDRVTSGLFAGMTYGQLHCTREQLSAGHALAYQLAYGGDSTLTPAECSALHAVMDEIGELQDDLLGSSGAIIKARERRRGSPAVTLEPQHMPEGAL